MMTGPTVDVLRYTAFSMGAGGGNPAGVVLNAEGLTVPQMIAIADDVGYSETAFLVPLHDDSRAYRTRFYSPRDEIAMCGHATIASAIALAERGGAGRYSFDTRVGRIEVDTTEHEGLWWAEMSGVPGNSRAATSREVEEVIHALGWTTDDLDPRFPLRILQPGNNHFLVPVNSREKLAALDYDYPELERVMATRGWTTIHAFWSEDKSTYWVRAPFPPGGLREDAATGSGASAFGSYLREFGLVDWPTTVTSYQGVDMGRPCRIETIIPERNGQVSVRGSGYRLEDLAY